MVQIFVSAVAHFFVVVSGSNFHEPLAHFFIDIYIIALSHLGEFADIIGKICTKIDLAFG